MFFQAIVLVLFTLLGMVPGLPSRPQPTPGPLSTSFTIYYGYTVGWPYHWPHYSFVPDNAEGDICAQIMSFPGLDARADVSGNKHGARIEGGSHEEPDDLEWNSPETGHYTLYKGRGHTIWPINGDPVGTCVVDHEVKYVCDYPGHVNWQLEGTSAFRCQSDTIHIWPTLNEPFKYLFLNATKT